MIDDGWAARELVESDYEPLSDYDDQMDAIRLGLQSEADSYCVHGTFVGNWAGPDYMCGYCEMGVSVEELEAERRWVERRDARRKLLRPKLAQLIEQVNAEARKPDRDEKELERLATRLGKYIGWRIALPMDVVRAINLSKKEA
jgi:hypothetical protein